MMMMQAGVHSVPGKEGGRCHLASRRNTCPAQELDPGDASGGQLDPGDAGGGQLDPGDAGGGQLDPGGLGHNHM